MTSKKEELIQKLRKDEKTMFLKNIRETPELFQKYSKILPRMTSNEELLKNLEEIPDYYHERFEIFHDIGMNIGTYEETFGIKLSKKRKNEMRIECLKSNVEYYKKNIVKDNKDIEEHIRKIKLADEFKDDISEKLKIYLTEDLNLYKGFKKTEEECILFSEEELRKLNMGPIEKLKEFVKTKYNLK